MTRSASLVAIAALLCCGATAPAMAAWVPLAAVPLGPAGPAEFVDASRELPMRVDAISLRADNADMMCRSVDAVFRSGQTEQLFSGLLPAGRENVIQMLPVHRDVARIDLHCRAANGGVGDINVAANVGGRVVVDRTVTSEVQTVNWIPLAMNDFTGASDSAMTFTGWRGMSMAALGLRPLNDDAVCSQMRVVFADGEKMHLNLGATRMPMNQLTRIGAPEGRHDVTSVGLDCHAVHGGKMTMQLLAAG